MFNNFTIFSIMNLLKLAYDCTMCDVISRELMKIDHKNRYMLLIIISSEQLHTSIIWYWCILWFIIHEVSHIPLKWMHILCVFHLYFWGEKDPQKGAWYKGVTGYAPPPHTKFNDCIYNCLVNGNQLLGDAVLVIFFSNFEILNLYCIYTMSPSIWPI